MPLLKSTAAINGKMNLCRNINVEYITPNTPVMKLLSKNWLTEDVIDAEYKRYVLLAYLADVQQDFNERKLYPHLADLVDHYAQLLALKENTKNLYNAFPEKAKQLDWENLRISYEKLVQNDALMAELEEIIDFSIPQFHHYLRTGKEIYDDVERRLKVEPVGVVPLYTNEGYMFIIHPDTKDTEIYEYQSTLFTEKEEKYRSLHTLHIGTYKRSIVNTPEHMKIELIRALPKLPNPAVYAIISEVALPYTETYLPIAKRALVKKLAA